MTRRATRVGLLGLLGACTPGGGDVSDTGDDSGAAPAARTCWGDDDVPVLTDLGVAHTADVAVRVGDEGGILGHAGLQVRLAPGAVPKGTEVRIAHLGVPPGDFLEPASPMFLVDADVPIEGLVQVCIAASRTDDTLDVQWTGTLGGWSRRPEPRLVGDQAISATIRTWGAGFASGPGPQTAALTDERAAIDLLSVIDVGLGMTSAQNRYVDAFPTLGRLMLGSGVDWHWGVVSGEVAETSKRNGRLEAVGARRFVSPVVPDPLAVHTSLALVGADSYEEFAGLDAVELVLTTPNADLVEANRGFRRRDAQLAVVFLSSRDDKASSRNAADKLVELLADAATPPAKARALAIAGPVPSGCTSEAGTAGPAVSLTLVAQGTGGLRQTFCEDDWTEGLLAFADLFRGTACQRLAYAPDLASIEVFDVETDDVVDPEHWLYDTDDRCLGVTLRGLTVQDGATWGVRYAPATD